MSHHSLKELLLLVQHDPWEAVQRGKLQYKSHRRRGWEMAVVPYAFALAICGERVQVERLYNNRLFQGATYERNPDKILTHCLQFFYDDVEGADSRRAREHASALKLAFEERMAPEEVFSGLEMCGGFEPFKAWIEGDRAPDPLAGNDDLLATDHQPAAAMRLRERSEVLIGDVCDEDGGDDEPAGALADAGGSAGGKAPAEVEAAAAPNGKPRQRKPGRYGREWRETHLHLPVTREEHWAITEMGQTSQATLTVRLAGREKGGYAVLAIQSVRINDRLI